MSIRPLPPHPRCCFMSTGIRSQPDPKICHPAAVRPEVPQDVPDHPLRPEAGEHSS